MLSARPKLNVPKMARRAILWTWNACCNYTVELCTSDSYRRQFPLQFPPPHSSSLNLSFPSPPHPSPGYQLYKWSHPISCIDLHPSPFPTPQPKHRGYGQTLVWHTDGTWAEHWENHLYWLHATQHFNFNSTLCNFLFYNKLYPQIIN